MSIVANLNAPQKEAVLSSSQYIRLIAGAGSGKTRVLTSRIAYLIQEKGVLPQSILAITFTNKAANEMIERLKKMLDDDKIGVRMCTIHSLCVRILREDGHHIDLPKSFLIMDPQDQRSILKDIYKKMELDHKDYPYAGTINYISNCKCGKVSPEEAAKIAYDKKSSILSTVYASYVVKQKELFALDFDDLLIEGCHCLRKNSNVLEKWTSRYRYIHVDEFQDIDEIQYDLICLLAGKHNHLCVVGDPDQTIYSWRGANVDIIIQFEKKFKPCQTIFLNENYRSTSAILHGANSLIQHNKNRIEKELFTNNNDNSKIIHFQSSSENTEAMWIVERIGEYYRKNNSYSGCAILYRNNFSSRFIEKALVEYGVPYVIYGGMKFYDRQEIKDMLCYLRMIVTQDDLAFERIINTPKRGIGDKTIDLIKEKADLNSCSLFEVCCRESIGTPTVSRTINKLVSQIHEWQRQLEFLSPHQVAEVIFKESGYLKSLEDNHEEDRIDNVKELINDIKQFVSDREDGSLEEYLQMITLYGDRESVDSSNCVQCMTVHASKGLEFNVVFVCNMSDGIFPSQRSIDESKQGLEEERRLAYVAFTRAKQQLYITENTEQSWATASKRTSRFILEMDQTVMQHTGSFLNSSRQHESRSTASQQVIARQRYESNVIINEKNMSNSKSRWKKGDLLLHNKFGEGVVIGVDVNFIDVRFQVVGVKKLLGNHDSITKL